MAYCTQADIENAKDSKILMQIAGTGTAITASLIVDAIAAAEAEIDQAICRYYTVPFVATVPTIVKYWTVQLALSRLYRRHNRDNEAEVKEADKIREMLRLIGEGKMSIPGIARTAQVFFTSPFTSTQFDEDTLDSPGNLTSLITDDES
jgi:phage gp36-like protein